MLTIGKLREHSAWVVGAIGVALLGFLVSEAYQSGRSSFGDNGPKPIAEIWGEKISADEFRMQYEKGMQNYRQRLGPEETITPAMEGQLNDQLWFQFSKEKVLQKEYDEVGIEVSGEEIKECVAGSNPHQIFLRVFSNPKTGQYDRGFALNFINKFDQQTPQNQGLWMDLEKEFVTTRLQEKFNNCVKSAIYVTDLEAKDAFFATNKVMTIDYVQLALNTIDDKDVAVTDEDITQFIAKHPDDYKKEETRSVDYVSFEIVPTQEDTLQAKNWIDKQLTTFTTTRNDSGFVSKRGKYSPKFQHRGELGTGLPEGMEERIFASDSGTIIGPEFRNGTFSVIKVSQKRLDSVFSHHASHILIKPGGKAGAKDSMDAMRIAVELMGQLKKGADFAKIAGEKSDDGSASKGGDLGWSPLTQWVKPFADGVARTKKGELTIVRSQFGVHVIKVLDNPSRDIVRYAMLERKVDAGSKTRDVASNLARDLRVAIQKNEDYDNVIRKKGLNKKSANDIKANDKFLPGIDNARELVRWAHDHHKGDVSDPLLAGNNTIIVAKIAKETHEGIAKAEDVRDQLTPIVRNEKKKDKLVEKMKEALEKSKDLQAIATATKGKVGVADNVTLSNTFLAQAGNEMLVVGYAFAMKNNETSKVIKGENGAYVIKVKTTTNIAAPTKYDSERNNQMRMEESRATNEATSALQESAKVKDMRFYHF
ncbi:MAG: SurA N-terminal domain-containing protein [Bacteroidetes bacterium]|nr:SurA N-terminal domain-containing protein [Bacteroidota bacterium]